MDKINFKEFLQKQIDAELDKKETFSASMQEQIQSEYDRLIVEREEWLENHLKSQN
jgi:hypothetical protein